MDRFLPKVERVRRDADPEKKTYLNGVVYVMGSLLGKQSCSNMIACRTGKFIQVSTPPPPQTSVLWIRVRSNANPISFFYSSNVSLLLLNVPEAVRQVPVRTLDKVSRCSSIMMCI
jgi:hypothetical protein